MHAAALTSPRLQRVLRLLSNGRPQSSLDIVRKAKVIAVSSCVAELRTHGAEINCQRRMTDAGWVFDYTMTKGPTPK